MRLETPRRSLGWLVPVPTAAALPLSATQRMHEVRPTRDDMSVLGREGAIGSRVVGRVTLAGCHSGMQIAVISLPGSATARCSHTLRTGEASRL